MSETTEVEFRASLREDYDRSLKLKGDSVLCYSPKKVKGGVPGHVIGEVLLKAARPPKPPKEGKTPKPEPPSLGRFVMGAHRLHARSVGTHNSFFYKKAGYVWVGGDNYLCLLTDSRPFFGALLGLILSTGAAVALALSLMGPVTLTPEHPMPDRDESSLPIEGEQGGQGGGGGGGGSGGGKVESEIGGGFVSMIYTKEAHVDLSDSTIDMYFLNPYKSNHSVVLELYVTFMDQHWLVAKSGRVDAGYGLKTMTFNQKVDLVPTTETRIYKGKYVIRFYDPETGERSVFTTEVVDVIFTVEE